MSDQQRPHPTGNTAINFEQEIEYIDKVRFMGELRKAENIDQIIEIVAKRFEQVREQIATAVEAAERRERLDAARYLRNIPVDLFPIYKSAMNAIADELAGEKPANANDAAGPEGR